MATIAESLPHPPSVFRQLAKLLKEELAPYPGRTATVIRIVISATLIALICLTFRIPYAFQGAIFTFIISRENIRATVTSANVLLVTVCISVVYFLVSAWFLIDVPAVHFLWNVGSFFLAFYGLSIITNYLAVVVFAIVIAVGVPLWDTYEPAETKVENVLWLALAAFVGVAVTAATEIVFLRTKPGDDVVLPLAERLAAVRSLLISYAENSSADEQAQKMILGFGMRGTSALRRNLRRSGYQPHYQAQMGAVAGAVGRLVDMAAALTELPFRPSQNDRAHLRDLASALATIRDDLLSRRVPRPVHFHGDDLPHDLPLLTEMEGIVTLIPQSFVGSATEFMTVPDDPRQPIFVADAFVNPDHLKFALKGCLAASACYFIYNAIDWPGISTAVVTCLLTALSTIGGSRQKQILRLAGVVAGGIVIGMSAQVFILPYLDSIGGFLVLFALVTALAAWFATSTPRISYFGMQLALAYYLINLQEFTIQTSLSAARDRTVGVLLGLFMMWLVFDQLWSAPAGVEIRKTFISTLRLLAQFSREPDPGDVRAAIQRKYALRETINASFDKVRSLADAVLFEFGPSRQRDLQFRDHVRQWQPKLRTLFLTLIALSEDRLQLTQFNLPERVRASLQNYEDYSAQKLEAIAGRLEGNAEPPDVHPVPVQPLEQALMDSLIPPARARSLVVLFRAIDTLVTSLDQEIATSRGQPTG